MVSLFETIIEIVSVPMVKWDKLAIKYKLILFTLVLISIASIVILVN